jgi:hypothetical protein
MSALPPITTAKADMYPANGHVCFLPKSGHCGPGLGPLEGDVEALLLDSGAVVGEIEALFDEGT